MAVVVNGAAHSAPLDGPPPMQLAGSELGVPQYGYCRSGRAATLLQNLRPTDAEINLAMTSGRCRNCARIRVTIHHAAELLAGGGRR